MISILRLASIIFAMLAGSASIDMAFAQSPKTKHSTVKSNSKNVSGIDTIPAKEVDDKNTNNGSGWNGSYIGVNAGTSFGATAGTNFLIPLGPSDQ